MTPEAEDACIEALRELFDGGATKDQLSAAAERMSADYASVVAKAKFVHRRYLESVGAANMAPDEFPTRHLQSWRDFLLAAARAHGAGASVPELCRGPRKLFLGWHFPEYPRWLTCARESDVLILVARRARWMERITGPEALCSFRDQALNLEIPRAFHAGRRMFAMMDYCYPDTTYVVSSFLGAPARSPAGLLRLARRFDYEVQVVSERRGEGVVLDGFRPGDHELEECVQRLDAAIEREVLSDPPRWLLWAVADHRWTRPASAI